MTNEKQNLTFISYSRNNKDFALELANELRASGFNIWFDLLDIPTGSRWDDEIERALERCEIFVVILTPSSITSANVKDEIGYAIDSNKRILPILLKDANVPLRLRRFQYVDFTDISYNEGIDRAKQLLRKLIDESASSLSKSDSVNAQGPQPSIDRSTELHADAQRLAQRRAEAIRKAREKEQLERNSQVTSSAPVIQKRSSQPQSQPQSQSKLLPIIIGVTLVAILCLGGGYMVITNFPLSTPTNTPTDTPTNTPSPTPTITATTESPTEMIPTTPAPLSPVQSIIDYWNYRSIKRYDLAWELLSPDFQRRNHERSLDNYLQSRQDDNYCKIETANGVEKSNDGSKAVITITVTYYVGTCPGKEAPHNFQNTLIYDTVSQKWLLDTNTEIK